jgi:hypothetical protein
VTKFCVVAPIFGPSERNLLHVTFVALRILRLTFLIISFRYIEANKKVVTELDTKFLSVCGTRRFMNKRSLVFWAVMQCNLAGMSVPVHIPQYVMSLQ